MRYLLPLAVLFALTACGSPTPTETPVVHVPRASEAAAATVPGALALPVSDEGVARSAALALIVGPDELVLDPDPLGLALDAGGRLAAEVVSSRGRVPRLQTELTMWSDTRKRMASEMGVEGPALALTVVADAGLPGSTLQALAASAHDSGLESLEIAVVRPETDASGDDGEDLVVVLDLGASSDGIRTVDLELGRDAIRVDGTPLTDLPPMTLYNAVLAARAADVDDPERQSTARRLALVLGDEVALQTVVDTLDLLRWRRLPADRATAGHAMLDDGAPFEDATAFADAVVVTDLAGQPVRLFDEVVLRVD